MLCYRCGGHVKDGSDKCPSCGQPFALGLKPGSIAGFGTGSRRGRAAIEGAPYKIDDAVAARFQIKDHLGAGPLGWVFRAVDTENGESISFKVLSPRFLQLPEEQAAFRSELERMHTLDHGNIARTIASGLDGPRPWIASQLLDGLTLRRIMDLRRQKGQGFALIEIEPIVAQIASALDASPVAHGNLKPDNVVVLPDLLKLTDFGLALCLPRAPFIAAQRAAGMQRYFAPEILAGAALGGRADVFSLGVMLGELLGGAPFDPHIEDRMRAAGVPEAVERVFLRAVAPRPEERFASAADLTAALSDAIHGEAMPSSEVEITDDDDVVIEHAQTDPRVRIARALAAQDAERAARAHIDSEARRAQATAGNGLQASRQLSLTPLPPLSVPPLSLPPLSIPPLSMPPLSIEPFSVPPAKIQPAAAPQLSSAATVSAISRAHAEPGAAAAQLATAGGSSHGTPHSSSSNISSSNISGSHAPLPHAARETNGASHQHEAAHPIERSPIAAEGVRGHASAEEIARVAARVGATPELLTAETAVRFAPTAPPAAAASAIPAAIAAASASAEHPLASSTPTASLAASPAQVAPSPAALSEDVFEVSEISEVSDVSDAGAGLDASEPPPSGASDDAVVRGKRRGRGRRGKRDEGRGRRSIDSAPPAAQPPAAATATGAQTHAPEPLPSARSAEIAPGEAGRGFPVEPRFVADASSQSGAATDSIASSAAAVSARASTPDRPGSNAPERAIAKPAVPPPPPPESRPPPSRPPAAPPSFGALATEKRGPSIPTLAIGAVLLIAAAVFAWTQFSSRGGDEKPAAESAPVAPSPSGAAPSSASPGGAAVPAPAAPTPAAAPATPPPAPVESAPVRAKEKEAVRAESPARDLDERPAKNGKKSFLERLRERRDASKHGQDRASPEATGHRAESEPQAAPTKAAEPVAAARPPPAPSVAAATSPTPTPPAPAPTPVAPPTPPARAVVTPPPAPAPAAAPSPGGIAGIGDDDLMASRDPEKRKRAAAEIALAAGIAPAPTAAAAPAPAAGDPCIDGMQLIAGGAAHIGTDPSDDMRNFGDRAPSTVQLKPYCIDLYEWPNSAGKAPKIAAGFSEADASCKKAGKRLCTEDEWEKACKGPANLRFPYGGDFDPEQCNTQDKATNPRHIAVSGAFASCKSGYGVYDLSGNAAEWTSSSFEGASSDKAVKGGNATRPGFDDRCSSRRRMPASTHDINVGFRCCSDAK